MNVYLLIFTFILVFLILIKPKYAPSILFISTLVGIPLVSFSEGLKTAAFAFDFILIVLIAQQFILNRNNHSNTEKRILSVIIVFILLFFFFNTVQNAITFSQGYEFLIRTIWSTLRISTLLMAGFYSFRTLDKTSLKQNFNVILFFFILFSSLLILTYFEIFNIGIFDHFKIGINSLFQQGRFNRASMGLICQMGIGFGLFAYTEKLITRKGFYLFIPILIFGLFISNSRSNIIAIAAALILVLLFTTKKKKEFILMPVLLIIILGIVSTNEMVRERLMTLVYFAEYGVEEVGSFNHRLYGWEMNIKYLLENPSKLIFGVGFSNYPVYLSKTSTLYAAHNSYLSILTELGILLGVFYLFIYHTLLKVITLHKRHSSKLILIIFLSILIASITMEAIYTAPSMYVVFTNMNIILFLMVKTHKIKYDEETEKIN